jgi:hypothetical protein
VHTRWLYYDNDNNNKTLRVRVWGDQGGWALANLEWWCMQVFFFIGGLRLLRDNFSADTSFFKVGAFHLVKPRDVGKRIGPQSAHCSWWLF